jgi:hypothetical protein
LRVLTSLDLMLIHKLMSPSTRARDRVPALLENKVA